MMKKYTTFALSILAILCITLFFLIINSYYTYQIGDQLKLLVSNFSISNLITIIQAMGQYFTPLNIINTLFLVALLFFCIYGFKWVEQAGTFYTFQYSWQKSKRYVLFFLPKYWGTSSQSNIDKENDIDLESGEKVYHNFEEFVAYKISTKWTNLNQLFLSSIVIVALCFMISFMMI
ncbi:MAG TPA: DUF3899 domain-containing protein [Firmicutes bacterium]|nr:DUF3899 domain-containing protein [Bacillota bacterium]